MPASEAKVCQIPEFVKECLDDLESYQPFREQKQKQNVTPLHFLCENMFKDLDEDAADVVDEFPVIEWLVDKGDELNVLATGYHPFTKGTKSPLAQAIKNYFTKRRNYIGNKQKEERYQREHVLWMKIFEKMLAKGADPNRGSLPPLSQFHYGCSSDDFPLKIELMKLLLSHGADVDKENAYGLTPLICAARDGDFACFQLLFERSTKKDSTELLRTAAFNLLGVERYHADPQAKILNYAQILKTLLAHTDYDTTTIAVLLLHASCENSGAVQTLLDELYNAIDFKKINKYTKLGLLKFALRHQCKQHLLEKLLIDSSSELIQLDSLPIRLKAELLILAIKYGNEEMIKQLLPLEFDYFAEIDILIEPGNLKEKESIYSALFSRVSKEDINRILPLLLKGKITLPEEKKDKDEAAIWQDNILLRMFFSGDSEQRKISSQLIAKIITFEFLEKLPREELNAWIRAALYDYQFCALIAPLLTKLHYLQIYDSGQAKDDWSRFARVVLENFSKVSTDTPTQIPAGLEEFKVQPPSLESKGGEAILLPSTPISDLIKKSDWTFLRVQGRTLLFKNAEGKIRAIKVQKKNEKTHELMKEYKTASYLNTNKTKLKLRGNLPQPINVQSISGLKEWLDQQKSVNSKLDLTSFYNLIDENNLNPSAYVYEANEDYFTYLNDTQLTDDQIAAASRKTINDLMRLLEEGFVYDRLIDLFHNKEGKEPRMDDGRYYLLVNLLRPDSETIRGMWGSGRLTHWLEGSKYPNFRLSGLADLGDYRFLEPKMINERFKEAKIAYGDKTIHYVKANFMAEYQYSLFLTNGHRCRKLTEAGDKTEDEIKQLWFNAAKQTIANCAQAMSIFANIPEAFCSRFLNKLVDVERLAKQMRFWMTNEYIESIKNNRIPDDLYEKGVKVEIIYERFRSGTFNDEVGFAIDGKNPDLGPVNGQEPIKEANKLFYWMVTGAFSMLDHQRLVKDVEEQVVQAKDYEDAKSKLNAFPFFSYKKSPFPQPEINKALLGKMGKTSEEQEHYKKQVALDAKRNRFYKFCNKSDTPKVRRRQRTQPSQTPITQLTR